MPMKIGGIAFLLGILAQAGGAAAAPDAAFGANDVLYMVVDLESAGNGACRIDYVTEDALTNGVWGAWTRRGGTVVWTGVTNDVRYATSKLVLRRIPAGPFPMGCRPREAGRMDTREFDQRTVALSEDYYVAVFEFTQGQWCSAVGAWPACVHTNDAARRPVENVTFAELRGAGGACDWPRGRDVDPKSFIGRLNAKTGLRFDLPTESRWEKACRAGAATPVYDGPEGVPAAPGRVARTAETAGSGPHAGQHAPVGGLEPNGYGLYDMLGNIREMCLDGFWQTSTGAPSVYVPVDDDEGPSTAYPAGGRVCKGGHYGAGRPVARCGARSWISVPTGEKSRYDGFRLCLARPDAPARRFRFDDRDRISILQVADIQDFNTVHPRTLAVISNACVRFRPAFMVLTGDNVDEPANVHGVFERSVKPFTDLARNVRVPFAVTFGNHDYRHVSATRYNGDEQLDVFRSFGGRYFIDHDVKALSGAGNGVIPIYPHRPARGEQPLFNVFLMDSHQYATTNYARAHYHDGVRSDQIAFYESQGRTPCLWFQHIPVPEMNGLLMFVSAHAPGAQKWRDGTYRAINPLTTWGRLSEWVGSCEDAAYVDAAHTYQGRTLYQSWLKMGNMRGAYFGHDHMNTFEGVDANGIRMGYTKAATLHVYSDKDPGVRLFTIHADGTFDTDIVSERHPGGAGLVPEKFRRAAR